MVLLSFLLLIKDVGEGENIVFASDIKGVGKISVGVGTTIEIGVDVLVEVEQIQSFLLGQLGLRHSE